MIANNDRKWKLIERLDWSTCKDYKYLAKLLEKMDRPDYLELQDFVKEKMDILDDTYREHWLGNPGIAVGDDGWSDLRAEVIGRGRKFYEEITLKKLQTMADTGDYTESFIYCFLKD